jgi:hypothetical protein
LRGLHILIPVLLLAGPSGAASAKTLYTAPVWLADGELVVCAASNVGSKPVSVLMQVLGVDGALITENTVEIAPGATSFASEDPTVGNGRRRCTFSFQGSAKSIRAGLEANDAGRPTLFIPAQ